MGREKKAAVLDWQTPTAPPSTRCDVNSVGAELERWFPGRVVARQGGTGGGEPVTVVRAENGVMALRVYVYDSGPVNAVAELPADGDRGDDAAAVPTVGDLRVWLRANYTEAAGDGVNLQGHRAGNTKAATRAAKTLVKHANRGSTVVMRFRTGPPGTNWEQVRAVVGKDVVEVGFTDGKMGNARTTPVGAVERTQEDYFPGQWWPSFAQAIAHALPSEYGEVQDPRGLKGCLTVDVRREGAGLKGVAVIRLRLEGPWGYGVHKQLKVPEKDPLYPMAKAMVAGRKNGDDGPGLFLLDMIQERVPDLAEYIETCSAWPAERERQLKEAEERRRAKAIDTLLAHGRYDRAELERQTTQVLLNMSHKAKAAGWVPAKE